MITSTPPSHDHARQMSAYQYTVFGTVVAPVLSYYKAEMLDWIEF